MKFENNPQLILTKEEFETLDKALKLCRDMDEETAEGECSKCPLYNNCTKIWNDCVYAEAHKALKTIINTAIVK